MSKQGSLRIIGGKWRSRKLRFPALAGVRPTPDCIRETLFNWLAPVIQDAVCLDPFAGSGALGFEALSRGARQVSFLDQSSQMVRQLRQQIEGFSAVDIASAQIARFPPCSAKFFALEPFTVIFLDPPFRQGLLAPSLAYLDTHVTLGPVAWVYIEMEATLTLPALLPHWHALKLKRTGQVAYGLLKRETPECMS